MNAAERKPDTLLVRLRFFLIAWVALILLWSVAFMGVERLTPLDALYFVIVTVTTVGYGDIHAATAAGKVMAMLTILTGAGTFGGLVASVTEVLLTRRERLVRQAKLNMVIGAFYAEVGTDLLVYFSDFDARLEEISRDLILSGAWTDRRFEEVSARIRGYEYSIDVRRVDFERLRAFLVGKRGFLLRMLENPSLMEHELFTDLLLAVFHLAEELHHRKKVAELPETDLVHLAGDVKRIYSLLVHQWLDHMRHLRASYPYLFSLAIRTNPFDEHASPIVTS